MHILFSIILFFESCAAYEIMWKNNVEPGRSQMTIWCMRIAWWMHMVTVIHSEYVVIIAFPWQQWLQERGSVCVIVHCLSCLSSFKTSSVFCIVFQNSIVLIISRFHWPISAKG